MNDTNLNPKVIDLKHAKELAASAGTPGANSLARSTSRWRAELGEELERRRDRSDPQPFANGTRKPAAALDREFVKTGDTNLQPEALPDPAQQATAYHPLAEKTLKKLERAAALDSPKADLDEDLSSEVQSRRTDSETLRVQRSRRQRKSGSESVERIEIDLNQGWLPFDADGTRSTDSGEDTIQEGLVAAPLATRFRAAVVDLSYTLGCFLIFLLIVFFLPDFSFLTKSSFVSLSVVAALIGAAYLFLFISLASRTLGMDHYQILVVRFDGKPPTLRDTGIRCLGYCISLGCFGLGFLWMVFDPERLAWHDRVSRTLVVEYRYPSEDST